MCPRKLKSTDRVQRVHGEVIFDWVFFMEDAKMVPCGGNLLGQPVMEILGDHFSCCWSEPVQEEASVASAAFFGARESSCCLRVNKL